MSIYKTRLEAGFTRLAQRNHKLQNICVVTISPVLSHSRYLSPRQCEKTGYDRATVRENGRGSGRATVGQIGRECDQTGDSSKKHAK